MTLWAAALRRVRLALAVHATEGHSAASLPPRQPGQGLACSSPIALCVSAESERIQSRITSKWLRPATS